MMHLPTLTKIVPASPLVVHTVLVRQPGPLPNSTAKQCSASLENWDCFAGVCPSQVPYIGPCHSNGRGFLTSARAN